MNRNDNSFAGAKTLRATYIESPETLSNEQLYQTMLAQTSAHKIDSLNWPDYPYAPAVTVRVAFSEDCLVLLFEVEEEHVKAVTLNSNGPVWEDSCVEFFTATPDGEGYFNFEANCVATLLAARRKSRNDAQMFTEEQIGSVRLVGSLPKQTIDSRGAGQKWWMLEVIPFRLLGWPSAPERIRANFYKCGDNCDKTHFLSWSPIDLPQPNFHCPNFFGTVELARE